MGKCAKEWGNYAVVTESGELEIQWGNVLRLLRAVRDPNAILPPPFGQIKFRTGAPYRETKYIWQERKQRCRRTNGKRNPDMGTGNPEDLP